MSNSWKNNRSSFEATLTDAVRLALNDTVIQTRDIIKTDFLSGSPLKLQSGNLNRSVEFENADKNLVAKVGILRGSTASKYAAIHEFGGVIKPKAAKALRFEIGTKVIFAKKVTIPARPYLRPGARRGVKSFSRILRVHLKRAFR